MTPRTVMAIVMIILPASVVFMIYELDRAVILMQHQCEESGGQFTDHCERKGGRR